MDAMFIVDGLEKERKLRQERNVNITLLTELDKLINGVTINIALLTELRFRGLLPTDQL